MSRDLLIQLLVKGAVGAAELIIKESREKFHKQQQERGFLTTTLVQSLTCFQQGLEQLAGYLEHNTNAPICKKEWRNLIKEATKACSVETYAQIPMVCYSLGEVIPLLSVVKDEIDPGNPALISAKNAFKYSSLVASAVFQSIGIETKINHLLFYTFATVMMINAAVMQHFTTPELLATVVIGHMERLQLYSRGWVGKLRNDKNQTKLLLLKCVDAVLALAVRLNLNLKPEVRVELNEGVRACQTSGLFSLVSQFCLITQTSFGQQGVRDEEFDGPTSIAVNSEGLVIVADPRNHKIKAISANGKVVGFCDPIPEDAGGNMPLLIAINRRDEIFALLWKESTRKTTIVKLGPSGRFMLSFDTSYGDVRREVIPCGMAVSSRGFVYLGDESNECIYILEQDGASLSPRNIIRTPGPFSFCLGPNDNLIVAARRSLVIFYEDSRARMVTLKWHNDTKIKEWKPLGVAYDADFKHVLVITAGKIETQINCFLSKTVYLKPTMWVLSAESYKVMSSMQIPFCDIDDTYGRFDVAAGRNGLWCVTEATHRVHCFTMMYHHIKP